MFLFDFSQNTQILLFSSSSSSISPLFRTFAGSIWPAMENNNSPIPLSQAVEAIKTAILQGQYEALKDVNRV